MRRARRRSRPSRPWSPHRVSRQSPRARCLPPFLEIVAGGEDLLDVLLLLFGVAHERLHVDDPLALLAGDLRPVVGVGRIRQILVLLELFAHGIEQVAGADALLAATDQPLEGQLLGPPHDRLDHGARDRKSTRLNSSHGYISYA